MRCRQPEAGGNIDHHVTLAAQAILHPRHHLAGRHETSQQLWHGTATAAAPARPLAAGSTQPGQPGSGDDRPGLNSPSAKTAPGAFIYSSLVSAGGALNTSIPETLTNAALQYKKPEGSIIHWTEGQRRMLL